MKDRKREILLKVSRGEITPEAAAQEMDRLEPESPPEAAERMAAPPSDLRRVRIVTRMGSVTVIGDASVREAVADGPHRARRQGDTLVFEADDDARFGFTFGSRGRFRDDSGRRLLVRMNPALALDTEVSAGSLKVEGVDGPIRARTQAGSTRISEFRAQLELDVQAGSVNAWGRLDEGASHIRCHAGSVNINLLHGSSVRVRARTSKGRVNLPYGMSAVSIGGGHQETIVGGGRATLDIESEMGSVNVTADS